MDSTENASSLAHREKLIFQFWLTTQSKQFTCTVYSELLSLSLYCQADMLSTLWLTSSKINGNCVQFIYLISYEKCNWRGTGKLLFHTFVERLHLWSCNDPCPCQKHKNVHLVNLLLITKTTPQSHHFLFSERTDQHSTI